jgi:16S rRNA (guanine527-N7)-methyltransferase
LIPHILKAGVELDGVMPRLRQFATLLTQWNRGVSNLISRNDEPRLVSRHLLESISCAYWLRELGEVNWMDFGSGGGLPAMPLAICGVGARWTLVESRRTKVLFLRRAVQELGLDRVSILHARLEDVAPGDVGGEIMGFTSRATLHLDPTLELAHRFVVPGGRAFLWKGSRREDEMKKETSWAEHWELDGLLGVGTEHTVVCRFARKTTS